LNETLTGWRLLGSYVAKIAQMALIMIGAVLMVIGIMVSGWYLLIR
jgi:hypothetical protein